MPPGDDAGVFLLGDIAIVETVDVMSPVVNDPYTFGAISATNSLSDIYAMGGKPISCLAIAGFPLCSFEHEVLRLIMKGAIDTIAHANAVLLGGHSFDDTEIKFGLAVTGVVDKDKILRADTACHGDVLILTKPIGTGVITTALKGQKLTDEEVAPAVRWMLLSNKEASELALQAHASACTDVTGFGLLGHALNMLKNKNIDIIIDASSVPTISPALKLISRGLAPEGAYKNLQYISNYTTFASHIDEDMRLLLADPQTSGGLLIAIKEKDISLFAQSGIFYALVGKVTKGSGVLVVR